MDAIYQWKKITVFLLVIVVALSSIFWDKSSAAIFRWSHPQIHFPVPKPFNLKSVTKDVRILGGESATISIISSSTQADTVLLKLTPLVSIEMDSTQALPQ